MKTMIAAVAMLMSTSAMSDYKPFNTGKSMTFECQTGVVVHVVDDKNVVINGDFDAKVSELSENRLQAQGYHGQTDLTTVIDLRFMGGGFYSLLTTELDQAGSKGPWDDKVLGVSAVICKRAK